MSQVVVTARIDAETAAKLDRIGAEYDRKRSWLIARAIERYASEGAAYLDFLQEGDDAIDRGDVYTTEEVMAEFRDLLDRRKSAA